MRKSEKDLIGVFDNAKGPFRSVQYESKFYALPNIERGFAQKKKIKRNYKQREKKKKL